MKWFLPNLSHDKCWQSRKVSPSTLSGKQKLRVTIRGTVWRLHQIPKESWRAEYVLRACEVLDTHSHTHTRVGRPATAVHVLKVPKGLKISSEGQLIPQLTHYSPDVETT